MFFHFFNMNYFFIFIFYFFLTSFLHNKYTYVYFQAIPQYGILSRCTIGFLLWDNENSQVIKFNFKTKKVFSKRLLNHIFINSFNIFLLIYSTAFRGRRPPTRFTSQNAQLSNLDYQLLWSLWCGFQSESGTFTKLSRRIAV